MMQYITSNGDINTNQRECPWRLAWHRYRDANGPAGKEYHDHFQGKQDGVISGRVAFETVNTLLGFAPELAQEQNSLYIMFGR